MEHSSNNRGMSWRIDCWKNCFEFWAFWPQTSCLIMFAVLVLFIQHADWWVWGIQDHAWDNEDSWIYRATGSAVAKGVSREVGAKGQKVPGLAVEQLSQSTLRIAAYVFAWWLPSSNQTWQWKFPIEVLMGIISINGGFYILLCLKTGGYKLDGITKRYFHWRNCHGQWVRYQKFGAHSESTSLGIDSVGHTKILKLVLVDVHDQHPSICKIHIRTCVWLTHIAVRYSDPSLIITPMLT